MAKRDDVFMLSAKSELQIEWRRMARKKHITLSELIRIAMREYAEKEGRKCIKKD